jgi:hypothetical protein
VAELPHFQSCRLSGKGTLFWADLWDTASHSWKEWHALAQEYGLLALDHLSIMDL